MLLRHPHAAVKCQKVRNKYVVSDDKDALCVVKGCIEVVPIDDAKVVFSDGSECHPMGRFYRIVSTIDPWHFILDIF